jgi:uncharacterized membrane protein YhhN
LELGRVRIPALLPNQNYQTMKHILTALAVILGASAQMIFIGINGLTLISVPITIYLGILVMEKITETEKQINI